MTERSARKPASETDDSSPKSPGTHEDPESATNPSGPEATTNLLRRQREALVEATEALEASHEDLDSLGYSISHDLRSPLRTIEGLARALAEDHAGSLDDASRELVRRIRQAADRMSRMVDDLFDLSRTCREPLRRTEVDLSTLARSVADEMQGPQKERPVDLHIHPGIRVFGHEGLIRLVLENLLGNAMKFTRHRDPAVIEVLPAEEGREGFLVRDNGIGFDMSQSERIFAPFTRLHEAEQFEGNGIGLAIVRRIVVRHGGRVEAFGRPGEGAELRVYLPGRS